jgi:hypothetical protein
MHEPCHRGRVSGATSGNRCPRTSAIHRRKTMAGIRTLRARLLYISECGASRGGRFCSTLPAGEQAARYSSTMTTCAQRSHLK